jgi:hypothetical protein
MPLTAFSVNDFRALQCRFPQHLSALFLNGYSGHTVEIIVDKTGA